MIASQTTECSCKHIVSVSLGSSERNAGVRCLITTTPSLDGRSYGTNVMEGLLVAASGADKQLDAAVYEKLLEEYKIESGLEYLNGEEEHI